MGTRVTQHDIARRVGISQRAVSLALSNDQGVSDRTRARVLRAATELKYRVSAFARATRTGRTGCFALVLSTTPVASLVPQALLAGIAEGVAELDHHLLLATLPDEKLTSEGFVPKILRELAADGLLINYNAFIPAAMIALIRRYEIPSVWINSKQAQDCVHPDDVGGARLAAEYLLRLGHRRIAYADYTHRPDLLRTHYSAADRRQGYLDALREAGLAPFLLGWRSGPDSESVIESLTSVLESPHRPTAVLCYGARESRAVYHAARLLGLRVPQDLSIVRFGSAPFDDLGMEFTVTVVPEYEVGRQAVAMLDAKLRGLEPSSSSVAVPFRLHEGASAGPPASAGDCVRTSTGTGRKPCPGKPRVPSNPRR